MARLGGGGILDALAIASAPLRSGRHAGWVCPSCRDQRPLKQQRRHAHSNQAALVNNDKSNGDDPVLAFDSRESRRLRWLKQQDPNASTAPPAENYPLRAFLARQRQDSQQKTDNPIAVSTTTTDSPEIVLILAALREHDPNKLVAAIGAGAETSPASLRSIPLNTWTEIIKTLDPRSHVIAPLHDAHRALTGRKNSAARAVYQHSRASWIELLSRFVDMSQRIGTKLDLAHYRLLLKFAANMGANNLSRTLWREMQEADISPDLDCYNYRMEAMLFNEGSRLLQTKGAQGFRSEEPDLQVHTRIALFRPGDSPAIKKLVRELETKGIKANTRTYCNLITALARDGDLTSVAKILSSVWRLNVDAVMAGEATSHISTIEPGTPLFPSARILVTIADAFGSHSRLAIAVRLIDIISQHYNVPVRSNVWFRLLQWTGLYARLANDEARKSGRNNSSQSRSSRRAQARRTYLDDVDMLFQTMTGAPYNVRPTMDMLHFIQKNSLGQGLLGTPDFTIAADAGKEQYARAVAAFREGQYQLRQRTGASSAIARGLAPPGQTARMDRRARMLQLRKTLGLNYLKWWTHLIVEHSVPASTELVPEEAEGIRDWQLRGLPDFAASYRGLMPRSFKYWTPGGLVELVFRTPEDVEDGRRRKPAADRRRRFHLVRMPTVQWPWQREGRGQSWTGRSKLIANRRLASPRSLGRRRKQVAEEGLANE